MSKKTAGNSLQILLVEDNSTDALLVEEYLVEAGMLEFALVCVSRLDGALESLRDHRFDLVLLDLGLPDSQGLETFARMQLEYPTVPILILSGLEDEGLAVRAVKDGAQDFLVKGKINSTMLSRTIRYAIERKRSEQRLKASEVGYRRLFETTQDGIFILDAETGKITDANPYLEQLLGYTRTEFIGKRLWEIAPFRDKKANQAAFATLKENGYISYADLPLAAKSGHDVDVEFVSNVYVVGNQRVIQCNIRDITQRKHAELLLAEQQRALESANEKLEMLAHTDGLTGLRNYRSLQELLNSEFDRSSRYQTPLSLVLLDVDKFKHFNDTFGHPAGDEVLRNVARVLQREARSTDLVARYGGEEFAVVLTNTDTVEAWIAAERFRNAIEAAPWQKRAVTASFGVTTKSTASINAAALINAADSALYQSKVSGRNLVTQTPYKLSQPCENR